MIQKIQFLILVLLTHPKPKACTSLRLNTLTLPALLLIPTVTFNYPLTLRLSYLTFSPSLTITTTFPPLSSQWSTLRSFGHFHASTDAISSFLRSLLRSDADSPVVLESGVVEEEREEGREEETS